MRKKAFDSTLLLVFTQVDLSDANRTKIKDKLNYVSRKANLDYIDDEKIEKTCEYLEAIIEYFGKN